MKLPAIRSWTDVQYVFDQIAKALGGRRIDVRGVVSAAGVIAAGGSGFKIASHPAAGIYNITYDHAFTAEPIVQVTMGLTGGILINKVLAHSPTGCQVVTFLATTGANTDSEFFFSVDGG